MTNQQLANWPNPTEKPHWIYLLQTPEPAMLARHATSIQLAGGFWAAAESPAHLLQLFASRVPKLLNLHWRHAAAALPLDGVEPEHARMLTDALARLRLHHGKAVPSALATAVRRRFPLLSLPGAWNTTPPGRWRRARESEALHNCLDAERRESYAQSIADAKAARVAARERQMAGYTPAQLHRIAQQQRARGGPNVLEWEMRAEAAAQAAGMRSRFEHDDARIAETAQRQARADVRASERQQTAAIRKLRQRAAQAAREGDTTRATYLRQQAADLNRITIDPATGEHVMTHQPPARPERGTHGGRRPGTGGARPGAGRKPLFAPAPPEPGADSTAHADVAVSAARRWSVYASYLAKHFTYVTATGEVIGPSGRALDLRHPVSTPIGALRPGPLIAALLHGTVTRRYALPRGSEPTSRWPLHTLSVSVVDRERDAGLAQPGTPAHLLVPPLPRLHGAQVFANTLSPRL